MTRLHQYYLPITKLAAQYSHRACPKLLTDLHNETHGTALRQRLELITLEELAATLDITVETLREWRRLKQGPDYVRTGKGVAHREVDIQEWLKRNVVLVIRA